jgi:hypothetical protein
MRVSRPAASCKWLLVLAAAVLLAALPGVVPQEPHGASLIAEGEAPDLFLLYTGDVIGLLDPCG